MPFRSPQKGATAQADFSWLPVNSPFRETWQNCSPIIQEFIGEAIMHQSLQFGNKNDPDYEISFWYYHPASSKEPSFEHPP